MSAPLAHVRVPLALRELRSGSGRPLLLLHGLRESAVVWAAGPAWRGSVFALDFSGHGTSGRVRGGVYYPELLAADADQALARLGEAVLVGRGLGAYVALLLAGARPEAVPAAVLLGGRGLAGSGPAPTPDGRDLALELARADAAGGNGEDFGLLGLELSVRPADYAASFAAAARRLVFAEAPREPPAWWKAARAAEPAEACRDLTEALARLAATES